MALTRVTGKVISDNVNLVGIVTALNFKTGTTNVHNVGVEAAGFNVLGGTANFGAGGNFVGVVTAAGFNGGTGNITLTNGNIGVGTASPTSAVKSTNTRVVSAGIVTANKYYGDGSNLTNVDSIVFIGFKRDGDNLVCHYSTSSDSNTYSQEDFLDPKTSEPQWYFGNSQHTYDATSLATTSFTRPDGSTPQLGEPKYRLHPSSGRLILTT